MYVRMARISPLVSLSVDDLAQVVRWEAVPSTPQQVALRCRLVLAAASGKQDLEIASTYDVNRHTAALWRQRVRAAGIGSLWEIQPGRGRKPKYVQEKRRTDCRDSGNQTQRHDALELPDPGESPGSKPQHRESALAIAQSQAAPEPHLQVVARFQVHREVDRCGGFVPESAAKGDRVMRR